MDGMKSKEINKFQHRITAVSTEDLKRGNSMIRYNKRQESSELFLLFLKRKATYNQEALNINSCSKDLSILKSILGFKKNEC